MSAYEQCASALKNTTAFSSETEGICDTQVLFFNYRQQIRSERVVTKNAAFQQNVFTSSLVHVGVQQYFTDDAILIRGGRVKTADSIVWDAAPVAVSAQTYNKSYGNLPTTLSAYRINGDTALTSYLSSQTEETYTFVYELKPAAAYDYAKQVQTMGGLGETPSFQTVRLTLVMDAAFKPISAKYEETYTISIAILGETTCKAEYIETFSYDNTAEVPETAYFAKYLSLACTDKFPEISSGYNLLFSFFENSSSYNLNLTTAENTIPMHVSFDTYDDSIYLHGDDFSFLYRDDRYYVSFGSTNVFVEAEALNEQILPFSELSSSLGGLFDGASSSDPANNMTFETVDGMITIRSEGDMRFCATVEMSSMNLVSAELSGDGYTLALEKSPVKTTVPSTDGYTDITSSVSALSFIGALASGETIQGKVQVSGDVTYSANMLLSLSDDLSLSLISEEENIPLSVYLQKGELSAVWENVAVHGSLTDVLSLLSLFGGDDTVQTVSVARNALPRLVAEDGKLTYFFEDGASYLVLNGETVQYVTEFFAISVTLDGKSAVPVMSPPEASVSLNASDLYTFLDGSVYPQLLGAGTVESNLKVKYGENTYDFSATISTDPFLSVGLATKIDGNHVGLIYTDGTFYLSHPSVSAYVSSDKLETVLENLQSLATGSSGAAVTVPAISEIHLRSISCSEDQLALLFDEMTVYLAKETFRIVADDVDILGTRISSQKESSVIVTPSKKDCVDLYRLSERISALAEQNAFSFTGKYLIDDLDVTFSRMDFKLNSDYEVSSLAAELTLDGLSSQIYSIYYDGESVYLQTNELKLFALAESIIEPLQSLNQGEARTQNLLSSIDLSDIKSIKYSNDILSVELDDAMLTLTWEDGTLSQVYYVSKTQKLLLKRSEALPFVAPSLNGYTDISSIGDLIVAVANTAEQENFNFEGTIDLNVLSIALTGISANGSVWMTDGGTECHVLFDVPYIQGVTSNGVSLMNGLRILQGCDITGELYVMDGVLYMTRTINAQYRLFQTTTVTKTESRFVSIDEFMESPFETLSFLFNLESDVLSEVSDKNESDPALINPLKRFTKKGNVYTLELTPEVVFPAADEISVSASTDGTYVTGFDAEIGLSVLSVTLSGELSDYGTASAIHTEGIDFSSYAPLQNDGR